LKGPDADLRQDFVKLALCARLGGAAEWNERWQKVKRGDTPAPADASDMSRDQAEVVRQQ
jgi:hypothetical protein